MTALLASQPLPDLPLWMTALAVTPALVAALAALAARRLPVAAAWRVAGASTAVVAVAAAALAAARITVGPRADGLVRVDNVTVLILLLISLIGAVVVRYSATALSGDAHERRYAGRLLATLAAVGVVVIANNVLLLVAGWAGTSLALHGLLTHFGDRPVAVAVAHKKFLLARCADICMLGAAAAFWSAFSTLRIDAIVARSVDLPTLPTGARVGILLVAAAAVLKCAQLPFHGWLIQVMEAPTPVSALLHAGVVNLGGVVLLRFAPLVDRATETRALLVTIGVLTAVVGAVVMTTRVSVKVALAWSTCAQMGFLLMQCGLGIWEMALLHLLAHSVYKAHAFLAAGGTVRRTQRRQLAQPSVPPRAPALALATLLAVAGTAAVAALWRLIPDSTPLSAPAWVLLGIVSLALVPLALQPSVAPSRLALRPLLFVRPLAVPVAYLALHELFGRLVPHARTTPIALLAVAALGFIALFVLQAACAVAPRSAFVQRIRPWMYAGLFLDEAFTAMAFTVARPPRAVAEHNTLLPQRAFTFASPVTRQTTSQTVHAHHEWTS